MAYLKEKTTEVSIKNDQLLASWIQGTDMEFQKMEKSEIDSHTLAFDKQTDLSKDVWKTFSKEVLGEFSKLG